MVFYRRPKIRKPCVLWLYLSKQVILIIWLLGCLSSLQAQLVESFEDGDFSKNPEWQGDTALFTVRDGSLALDDPAPASSNEAYLSLPAPTSADTGTTWECLVRLNFSPSASNFARFYLGASASGLTTPLEGYYLQVGGISGDGDALELYRQDGASRVVLLSGMAGAVGGDPVTARVRVMRDSSGRWTLFADYGGGANFQLEGSAVDRTYPLSRYAGFYCRYSSTRSDRFVFDDIRIDPLFTDTRPPVLLEAIPLSDRRLQLQFDEPLGPGTSEPERYNINNGIGVPQEALFRESKPSSVELLLERPLRNFQEYELTASGIRDRAGNTAGVQRIFFTFLDVRPAAAGDLIITEIMADPTPPARLPEAEYLELFNRSDKVIPLGELRISSGGAPQSLPDAQLLPGEYVVLHDEEFTAAFAPFAGVLPVERLPSLTNSGDELLLLSEGGDTLLQQFYFDSWYGEEAKARGGWALERIGLKAPGDCPGNWAASLDPAGGTPGRANSVAGQALEMEGPVFLRVAVESPEEITLFFNEALDPVVAADPLRYRINPAIGVTAAFPQAPDNRSVLLILEEALQPKLVYSLQVPAGLSDCLANRSPAGQEQRFGLPEETAPGDIVINELLFYPQVGGADFVELYNRSSKIIDLEGLRLINARKMSGAVTTVVDRPFLLFPENYVVLTEDPSDIRARYEVPQPANLLTNDLPSLDSDFGNLTLQMERLTIDSFDYAEAYHSPLLEDSRGVSLERIDPYGATQHPGNWQSAAAAAGFATPTGRNSQFVNIAGPLDERFQLANKTFSPDGDGFEDALIIRYELDRPGYILNLRIFDAKGRQVRTLASNLLLATKGILKWDGAGNGQGKARIGIYLLWFELFTPGGDVFREKKTCVLAGRLND
jgi:hypothetical protein